MAIQNIVFDKSKMKPTVELLIGQAHHGSYRVYLWDAAGKKAKLIGSGVNWDAVEDVIKLGNVSGLNNKIITWEVAVSTGEAGPGHQYSLKVTFSQEGLPVKDGTIEDRGPLEGSKFIYGARKITVS